MKVQRGKFHVCEIILVTTATTSTAGVLMPESQSVARPLYCGGIRLEFPGSDGGEERMKAYLDEHFGLAESWESLDKAVVIEGEPISLG